MMKKLTILLVLICCAAVQGEIVNRYSFDDGDTTAVDSISGKEGTLTNTAAISGNKLVLNGSSAVELPSDILDATLTSVTVEAWFQDNSTGDNWSRLFDFGETNGGDGGNGMFCVARQFGGTRFTVATNGTPSWATGENTVSGAIFPGVETHVACVWDGPGAQIKIYINGQLAQSAATTMDLSKVVRENAYIGDSSYPGDPYFTGTINEFRIYDTALSDEEVLNSFNDGPDASFGVVNQAKKPKPGNLSVEISIDVGTLSWKPGDSIAADGGTHDVFIGTDEASVTNAAIGNLLGTTLYQDLDVNSVAIGRLEYGTTYYWRVDEVNLPSKPGTTTGSIWNFKTELKGYPLPPANIIDVTTAGTPAYDDQEPNSTCNGKGLDANDMHSTDPAGMWLAQPDEETGAAPWIQYEFDKVYMLYDMKVWNYNEESPTEEFGVKDANISYSIDGVAWTNMPTVQFNIATGDNTCTANTTVELNGAVAKFLRITFLTSFEGSDIYGLSEVRFSTEPTRAVPNSPANKATDQAIDVALNWKAGRYFDKHYLYISADLNDVNVVSPLVAPIILTDPTYITSLDLNKKYYWRVDEVNMANAYTTWDGTVSDFTTALFLSVDGFETGYGNDDTNAVWATWIDGFGTTDNGSLIGSGITAPGLSTTAYSGIRSAPVTYDNTGTATYSEVTAQSVKLPIGTSDWTKGSPTALVIWFSGAGTNTPDQLYAKINSTKVLYTGDPAYLTQSVWRPFVIDLAGVNLGNITSLTIGLEKITGSQGGTGVLLIDGIALYAVGPVIASPVNPGNTDLVASYSMENNVNDDSGNGLNGTIIGTPTYAQGMTGRGMAMQFNGTTDCIDLGNKAEFNPAGSFSVSLWANITTWTSGWGHVMVGNRGEGGVGWQLRRYSNDNFCFTTRGIDNDDTDSNANPPLNEWINITCVYDSVAHTKAIYFDGVLDRTVTLNGTVTQITATTHNTYIGARANGGNTAPESFFAGLIDEVRIYDRALSAGEVVYLSDPTP